MMDPPRLLDLETDELTRAVLEFGARERPAARVHRRVHAAATAAAAFAATAPLAAAPVVAKSVVAGIVTWAGVGLVAGAVTSGAVVFVTERDTHRVVLEHPARATLPGASREISPRTPEPVGQSIVGVENTSERLPSGTASGAASTRRVTAVPRAAPARAPAQSATAGDPLQRELALLDRARGALERGDAREALAALDTHGGRGVLTPEARVLRIEALFLRGDRPAASRLAESFLDDDARSPHAERVRALLRAQGDQ